MQISRIEAFPIDLERKIRHQPCLGLSGAYYGFAEVANNVIVKVTTDRGIVGWDEAAPDRTVTGETQK